MEARRERLVSEKRAFELELESRLATRRKQIDAAEVEHRAIIDRLRLVESDLDAVFFEAPPYAFPDQVAHAVEAGRQIYLAKPVACDVPGCLRVRAAADKAQKNGQTFLIDSSGVVKGHWLERDGSMANVKTPAHTSQILEAIDKL